MKNRIVVMVTVALSVCALALFAVAGCSSGSSSGSASAASSSASASSSAAASSASAASSESASTESASASAASSEAASSEAASNAASESAASESASAASASSASAEASSASAASSEASDAAGEQVFEGTVRVLDAAGIIDLQKEYRDMGGIDASMFKEDGTFAILVLKQPTDVTGMVADGTGPDTRTASVLGIGEHSDFGNDVVVDYGDLDQWKQLDGQNVVITAVVDDIWFPTDVSLPIAEPRVNNCKILS